MKSELLTMTLRMSGDESEGNEVADKFSQRIMSVIMCDFRSRKTGATINIVVTALGGGGIFANVYGASQLGIIGFLIVTIWAMITTFLTVQFLCISADLSNQYTCYALSNRYLGGKKGETITKLFIMFGNFCYLVNIIQIFADFMEYLLPILSQSSGFWTTREFVCVWALLMIFPFVMVKSIKHLENLSGTLLFFAFGVLLIMVINAGTAISTGQMSQSLHLFPTDYKSFFRGLAPITWSWAVQFNIMPVYMSLDPHKRSKKMQSVTYWTVALLVAYYIVFGISAIILWGNQINDDFITNLSYDNANYAFYYGPELATVTQFILCVFTFASIPIFAYEGRRNLHFLVMDIYYACINDESSDESTEESDETTQLIPGNNNPTMSDANFTVKDRYTETWKSIFIEGTLLIISAACVALFLKNLNWSLVVFGATYGCYIVYFIPSMVFFLPIRNQPKLSLKYKVFKFMALVIFVYGLFVGAVGLTEAFSAI